jgi:hypothetical protein
MLYPLYDELYEKAKNLKTISINDLCVNINKINNLPDENNIKDHFKEIYALILHHDYVTHNNSRLNNLPYDTTTIIKGKGLRIDPFKLPPLLQRILHEYIEMYSK